MVTELVGTLKNQEKRSKNKIDLRTIYSSEM